MKFFFAIFSKPHLAMRHPFSDSGLLRTRGDQPTRPLQIRRRSGAFVCCCIIAIRVRLVSECVLCRVLRVLRYMAMRGSSLCCVLPSLAVRREVGGVVRELVFTVAILAQGTNRGDALCAALLSNRFGSSPPCAQVSLL